MHRQLLCKVVRHPTPANECPGYDTKQSDGEASVMLPSLRSPLWPGVVAPDKGPIYELNRIKAVFLHYTDILI